ncbi:hypothetical protein BOW53_14800 [Solemya pervernicosa gill symbiont]|uniref:Uncharacterized protein n=2 Tax=Gammaproteobacteria incertae sedis TaxID=118884 RepID=A0A1T2L0Q5_9GAMM|nr:hypothetical protein [Candidatus Reidiella endopervernicosa]OOZ38658.1 hypothetical protein BOW53_14800 [Solemya pervernicosa gill symbiont]QKQ26028.1 hypothetical protein HUE57_06815 [Candidatus Reidiella endopervernicosa]
MKQILALAALTLFSSASFAACQPDRFNDTDSHGTILNDMTPIETGTLHSGGGDLYGSDLYGGSWNAVPTHVSASVEEDDALDVMASNDFRSGTPGGVPVIQVGRFC